MRTDSGNARFMHGWYQDDGIFCMRIEEFLEFFTQMIVCRDFTEQFFGVEYDQPWQLQRSFLATRTKEIMQDRQFIFTQEHSGNPTPV